MLYRYPSCARIQFFIATLVAQEFNALSVLSTLAAKEFNALSLATGIQCFIPSHEESNVLSLANKNPMIYQRFISTYTARKTKRFISNLQ